MNIFSQIKTAVSYYFWDPKSNNQKHVTEVPQDNEYIITPDKNSQPIGMDIDTPNEILDITEVSQESESLVTPDDDFQSVGTDANASNEVHSVKEIVAVIQDNQDKSLQPQNRNASSIRVTIYKCANRWCAKESLGRGLFCDDCVEKYFKKEKARKAKEEAKIKNRKIFRKDEGDF